MAIKNTHDHIRHTVGHYIAAPGTAGTIEYGTALVLCDVSGNTTGITNWGTGEAGDPNNYVCPSSGIAGEIFAGISRSSVVDLDLSKRCFHESFYSSATVECRPLRS